MDITIGINGFGRWDYTSACLHSIQKHEPEARVVVVDHAPDLIYPADSFAKIVRTKPMSYAGVMNYIVKNHPADWYLILNNDTVCTAPFLHLFEDYDPGTNYGCSMLKVGNGRLAIETWMIIFSQQSFDRIGPWDEAFEACGFEDIDWGIRAGIAGVKQEKIEFPFIHGTGSKLTHKGSRWDTDGYSDRHHHNWRYCNEKHGPLGGIAHV